MELGHTEMFYVYQIDKARGPDRLKSEAEKIGAICISAINGDGLEQFCSAVQAKLKVIFYENCVAQVAFPLNSIIYLDRNHWFLWKL